MSLFTIPAVLGSVIFAVKKPKNPLKIKSWFMIMILALSAVPLMGFNDAHATYNVGSKGVEHRGTDTTFKTATVEHRIEGAVPSTNGANNGFSVQNNHFVKNFAVGTGFLWAQSVVQIETPSSPTYTTHTCTTGDASYLCKLPNQYNMRGVTNFWTDDTSGTCPSGFVYFSAVGQCVDADAPSSFTTVSLSSSITRVDVNTYQELQSSGKIYMDQKVRTCTGSFSCGSYTTLYTGPNNTYANSNSYYGSQSISGTTEYGTQTLGAECGSCNTSGRVTFNSGTYLTQIYTVQGPGNPVYRASGDDGWPSEDNDDICWWDTITDGGSTFTTTARQDTACQS